MKRYLALAILALLTQSAYADVICLKTSAKLGVSKSRKVTVKTPNLISTSATTCPAGFTPLTQFVKEESVKTSFTGVWNLSGAPGETFAAATISFPEALSAAPSQTRFVLLGATDTTCTGSATNPTAPAGVLCVYEAESFNLTGSYVMYEGSTSSADKASRFGGAMYGYQDQSAASFYSWGTWAVTKP